MTVLGVIAAGGASTRMGRDKAGIELDGNRFVDRVYEALAVVVDEVLIGGEPGLIPGVQSLADPPGAVSGPLAALAAAMERASDDDAVLLVAVDQPFLRSATVANLLDFFDGSSALVPVSGGRRQVTCAVYPGAWAAEALAEATAGQGSLQSLLARLPCLEIPEVEWRTWGEDGRSWFSVDTPDLLDQARRLYGEGITA